MDDAAGNVNDLRLVLQRIAAPVRRVAWHHLLVTRGGVQSQPPITTVATMQPDNPSNPHSDGEQANTPDRHRNEKATWKDHDQPDIPHEDKAPRDPHKDYPDARDTVPR